MGLWAGGGHTYGHTYVRTDILPYPSWCRGQRPLSGPLPKRVDLVGGDVVEVECWILPVRDPVSGWFWV